MSFDFLHPDVQERSKAACKGKDTEFFFPTSALGINKAKAVCEKCPIKTPCLQFALENNEEHGIWGGTTERRRKVLIKQLGIQVKRKPMIYPQSLRPNNKKR